MSISFHPVRGLESNILSKEPTDGYVWFATDTKKIYYSNGADFISMGGNSSIFYGTLDTSTADTEQVEFIFNAEDEIEQSSDSISIPQKDDLILNSDGCFYRVTYIDELDVYANRLTLAGTGGTGGVNLNAIVDYYPTKFDESISVLKNQECKIKFNVTAKDSAGDLTSGGTVIWLIDKVQVATGNVSQGVNEVDFAEYVKVGTQKLQGVFSLDTGGQVPVVVRKTWTINVINIYPLWDYDISTINSGNNFIMSWSAIGEAQKTSHIIIDDMYEYSITSETSAQQNKTINRNEAGLSHGAHKIKLYVTATVNGVDFTSDSIEKELIFVDQDNQTPIIAIGDYQTSMYQYNTQKIPIVVYNNSTAVLFVNEEEKDVFSDLEGEIRYWNFTPLTSGTQLLRISAGAVDRTIQINAIALNINNSEVSGYAFKIKANQFASNNALKNWNENDVNITFSDNFDWVNGGLRSETINSSESRTYICIKSGTSMTINYKLFKNWFANLGKSVKFVFKITNCAKYDTTFLNCMNNSGVGLKLNAQNAIYYSGQNSVNTQYCEDSYIEYELDIWPSVADSTGKIYRYMIPWIDGVPAGITVYNTDNIIQANNDLTDIIIGSEDCDVYLYLVKVYEKHLTDDQHLSNFIADAYNANEMINRYTRNNIMDPISGDIDWRKVVKNNPNCQVHLYDIPRITRNKKDKISVYKYYLYKETDEEPIIYSGSDFNKNTIIKVQGTSSAAYGVAAFNIDTEFKDGILNSEGSELSGYSLDSNAIPVNYFTTKVNVASCEGGNNAINQEWYNKFQPYICQARKKNSKRRDTMQFKPGLLFIKDRNQETNAAATDETIGNVGDNVFKDTSGYIDAPYYKLYSVCNFGNSKKNLDVFHDQSNANEMCIEINDNQKPGQWMTIVEGFKSTLVNKKIVYESIDLTNESIVDDNGNPNQNYNYWVNALNDVNYAVRYANGYDDLYDDDGNLTLRQEQIISFFNLVKWMAKNDPSPYDATSHPYGYKENEPLPTPVTFDGYTFQSKDWKNDSTVLGGLNIEVYAGTYTHDTYEYRIAKLLSECEQHLIMDSFVFHYLFIERHSLVDNVAKNTFYSTEDGVHWNIVKDYDNDTADGNDNSGRLTLTYGLEPLDKIVKTSGGVTSSVNVFNAHHSVWFNFINGLSQACQQMYQSLDSKGAWSANNYLQDFTNWQDCIPERCWIQDYYRKYIRPYEVYDDNSYLQLMEGGKKTQQRKQYEKYQEVYLATKYQTAAILNTSNSIWIRGNSQFNEEQRESMAIPVTMYSDCYIVTRWGQDISTQRAKRGQEYKIYPLHNDINDETIYWLAPDTYSTIGDIGVLTPKIIRLAGASRLQSFSIGVKSAVPHLQAIDVKNNKLLKTLTIQNCTGLGESVVDDNKNQLNGQSLDLRQLTSLKKLNTEGSIFTSIALPNSAPIQSLQLNNVKALYAENLNQLETLTIKDSNGNNDYSKIETLLISNIDNSSVNSLNDLLIKVLNLSSNNLTYYGFQNINWKITNTNYIDAINHKITILDKLLTLQGQYYNTSLSNNDRAEPCSSSKALSGKITIAANVYNQSDSIEFYNNYVNENTYPNLDLNFEAENSKLYNVIIYDGNNNIIWQKKAQSGQALNEEFLSDGPGGDFRNKIISKSSTADKVYTFNNKWSINDNIITGNALPLLNAITEDLTIKPIFDESIRQYTIKFYKVNSSEEPITFIKDYGTKINSFMPTDILYKDDSELNTLETYSFLGYNVSQSSSDSIDFTDRYIVRGNSNYYPIFKKVNVRQNVHQDYFEYLTASDGYTDIGENTNFNFAKNQGCVIKPKKILTGKVTIPMYDPDGRPVIAIENFKLSNTITHIFLEEQSGKEHQLRYIGQEAFGSYTQPTAAMTKLTYFDFEKAINLREIKSYAFQNVMNLTNTTLSQNLYYIHSGAFNNAFNLTNKTFVINPSITIMGRFAFALNEKMINCSLIIGDSLNHSNLDIKKSYETNGTQFTSSSNYIYAIGQNKGLEPPNSTRFTSIHFYTDKYTQSHIDDNIIIYTFGDGNHSTAADFLGLNRDNGNAKPTNQQGDIIIN